MRLFNKNPEEEITTEQKEAEIEALKQEVIEAKTKKVKSAVKEVSKEQEDIKYVEREINLSLINDKLNYLISAVEEIKRMATQ
jgi:hypothetical protein